MRLLWATLAMVALLRPDTAHAQMETREGIALQNQMLELRRDLQALRNDPGRTAPQSGNPSTLGRTGAPPSAGGGELTTQLLDRTDRLEDAVRRLNGRIDELDNARQRQGADLAKQLGDIQFRLDNPGGSPPPSATGRPAGPPPLAASQPPTPLGTLPVNGNPPPGLAPLPTTPVRRTPELALQDGNAALARRDYAAAEAGAREALATGKGTPRAYDAQFLLAQAMLGERNYPQAAIAYGDSYDRNKQGPHAQDSLLGLASSLNQINEKRSACAALDTLRSQFPSQRPDVATRATALRTAAGCR